MKNILGLLIFSVLIASCAQLIHKGNIAINKEKYEKALEYKEGDIVEFKDESEILLENLSRIKNGAAVSKSGLRKYILKNRSYLLEGRFRQQFVTRYGLKGDRFQIIYNIKIPKKWNDVIYKIPYSYLPNMKKVSFKAKVIKVGRKCEPDYSTVSKCVGGTFFEDKLEFISWTPTTVKLINSILKKQSLINSKNKRMKQKELSLKRKSEKYLSSSQASSDSACIAQSKYNNAVRWLKGMKKAGVKTYEMIKVANNIPSFKARFGSFKSEYKKRSGKNWNRKCPKDYVDIVEAVKKKYGIFLM